MTLEEVIRYAIDGMIMVDPDLSPRNQASRIQELVDILIDFGNLTGESLVDLLNK